MKDVVIDSYDGKDVLVTGGAGFIGSHLVERLVGLDASVTVIDNLESGGTMNLSHVRENIQLVVGDVGIRSTVEQLGEFDVIFNLAAVSLLKSFRNPLYDLQTNVGGTINVLDMSRKWDAKLIHASTGSIYGNPRSIPIDEGHSFAPISPYGVSKLSAEFYCKLYHNLHDLDVTCLRYFNVYGPRQRIGEETGVVPIFVSKILQGSPITIFGDGLQTRDFLHVRDCVQANLLAAQSDSAKGETMNIGGIGVEVSILDLAAMIMDLSGIQVPTVFKEPKLGDIRRLVANSSLARNLIGYEPMVQLDEGLAGYIDYARLLVD